MRAFMTKTITYRWTVLDATAAWLAHVIDIWATPYRVKPRDVEGGRHGFTLGLPLLSSDGFRGTHGDIGYSVGQDVTFSLGLTIDPPSVQRFFREGYEWVDVPEEVSTSGKTIQQLLIALYQHDKERFAHFDPALVVGTYMAGVAVNWPQMIPNSPFKIPAFALNPYNQPWGDLIMLHFDYWGNTNLRAALINDLVGGGGAADVFMDIATGLGSALLWILSNDPWTGVWGRITPLALPSEQGEHKIKKVLARKALRGAPIQALPTTREQGGNSTTTGRTVKVMSLPPPRIELDGFGRQTIWPIRDPVPLLPQPFGRRMHESKLRFRITLALGATNTRIEILRGDSVYYREVHQLGEFILPGVHIWSWDGYDQDGVFDSEVLKGSEWTARVTVTDLHGRTSVGVTHFSAAPDKHRWVDCRIDSESKQIDVTVWNQFLNPSDIRLFDAGLKIDNLSNLVDAGAGWMGNLASPAGGGGINALLPSLMNAFPGPAGSQFNGLLEEFRKLFVKEGTGSDPNSAGSRAVSQFAGLVPGMLNTGEIEAGSELGRIFQGSDLDEESFRRLRTAVMDGIQRHWSRTLKMEAGEWNLKVSAKERANDATRTYLSSMGGVISLREAKDRNRSFNLALVEGLPVFNIWDPAKALPEEQVQNGWITNVDAPYGLTGAHELGHQVLIDRKDWLFSITHKGTSTIGQQSLSMANGDSRNAPNVIAT
ncbi:MAG: hypothetical protein U0271_36790, partial [Polyangiaceae bacterium]